ncbi:cell wall-binding repeat-containing protein [Actinokineospora sp. UTMC 2448]|uniref:cell wall-binding repeat-containing protein n=1 Tax=Actinokineospora sp. UTMC 2448 TaxID=2268449 RepID=UPI002164BFD6|nr:cell wall-binding repeat-containing protein [Actinokineospora sp. UTMC 2448]UVS79512.1 N-acetylmuramoyl-L-alanine amidase LytC precursor [Actinokineospora sp. UTMC 2448]
MIIGRLRRLPAGSRMAAAVLAVAIAGGALTAPQAAAAGPVEGAPIAKAEITDALRSAYEYGRRSGELRAEHPSAAAPPENCLEVNYVARHRVQYRYAGSDRYETAVCTSYSTWADHDATHGPKANAVVLARGDLYADALAGGPLAGYENAPLLLNPPQSLLPAVRTEIQRVLAPGGTVYLLGSTGALSASVDSALTSAGFVTKRLAGSDRFRTAIRVAEEMATTNRFFVATGTDFADALPAGAFAATYNLGITQDDDPATTMPIALLFTDHDVMPASTKDFITTRWFEHGRTTLYAAGAPANTAAFRAFGGDSLYSFVGEDRFDTAAEVAEYLYTDVDNRLVAPGVGLANGMNFPDALAGTTVLMRSAHPLLLTPPTTLVYATSSFLRRHRDDHHDPESGQQMGHLSVFGGTPAVSADVVREAVSVYLGG